MTSNLCPARRYRSRHVAAWTSRDIDRQRVVVSDAGACPSALRRVFLSCAVSLFAVALHRLLVRDQTLIVTQAMGTYLLQA